jgi:hypothetical protein
MTQRSHKMKFNHPGISLESRRFSLGRNNLNNQRSLVERLDFTDLAQVVSNTV